VTHPEGRAERAEVTGTESPADGAAVTAPDGRADGAAVRGSDGRAGGAAVRGSDGRADGAAVMGQDSAAVTAQVVASAWVHIRERRVLVARPAKSDAFYLPGGKPEPGETYAEAAAREVKEEVGIVLSAADLTLFTEIVAPAHNRPPGTEVRLICFTGGTPDDEPRAAAEIAELDWFTRADAPRCAPAIRLLLAELAAARLID
jgi:8-oxo-dGTP diphosphatase